MRVMLSVALAAVLIFYLIVFLRRLAVRPRLPVPAAATPELTDEPPAVVNLLTHRMKASYAASATLLDLAARRVVELIEVGPQTLVRLRGPAPAQLHPHQALVLERLRRVAGSNAVSVAELRVHHGNRWHKLFTSQVARDARRLGLTRSTDDELLIVAMICAGVAVSPIGVIALGALWIGLLLWAVLALFGGLALYLPVVIFMPDRDRLTPLGRKVTAHWLGVAEWLRRYEPLRDLPPAAVAVWDRYLAYGAALGVMPNAVAVLDLETAGRRDVVWSEHTGVRRPVRVNYREPNRFLWPLGPIRARVSRNWAVVSLVVWAVVAFETSAWTRPYRWVPVLIFGLAVVQLGRAAYRLVCSTMDIGRPTRMTGTVIDITVAVENEIAVVPEYELPDDVPSLTVVVPVYYYFVVDDGSSDQVRPWLVDSRLALGALEPRLPPSPDNLFRLGFSIGDTVHLEGEPHSRYASVLIPRPTPETREGKA